MARLLALAVVLVVVALSLTACATVGDVPSYKPEGVVRTYPVTYDQAWVIASTLLQWKGAHVVEEHRQERYMSTTIGSGGFHWGAVMGVWIEPVTDASTQVTIVTKRRMPTIGTPLTEAEFHRRFADEVEAIKASRTR